MQSRVPLFHVMPLHAASAAHLALQSGRSNCPTQTSGNPSHEAAQFAGPLLLTGTPCPPPQRIFPPAPPTSAHPQSPESGVHAGGSAPPPPAGCCCWALAHGASRASNQHHTPHTVSALVRRRHMATVTAGVRVSARRALHAAYEYSCR